MAASSGSGTGSRHRPSWSARRTSTTTDSDVLAGFISEAVRPDADAQVKASDLYDHYKRWAEQHGLSERERLSSTAFGRKVSERVQKHRTPAGNVYLGLARRMSV